MRCALKSPRLLRTSKSLHQLNRCIKSCRGFGPDFFARSTDKKKPIPKYGQTPMHSDRKLAGMDFYQFASSLGLQE